MQFFIRRGGEEKHNGGVRMSGVDLINAGRGEMPGAVSGGRANKDHISKIKRSQIQ